MPVKLEMVGPFVETKYSRNRFLQYNLVIVRMVWHLVPMSVAMEWGCGVHDCVCVYMSVLPSPSP